MHPLSVTLVDASSVSPPVEGITFAVIIFARAGTGKKVLSVCQSILAFKSNVFISYSS